MSSPTDPVKASVPTRTAFSAPLPLPPHPSSGNAKALSLPNPLPGKAASPEEAPRPVWDGAPEQPLPKTGDGAYFFDDAIASSTLRFVPNLSQKHVVLKIFNEADSKLVCWVFIRDGDYVQIQIPPGKYCFKTATGSHWYGEEHLFGPNAAYAAISNSVTIPYGGLHIVDCNPAKNGVLVETRLDPKDF